MYRLSMTEDNPTDMLLVLHKIEDRLTEIVDILRLSQKESLESAKISVLSGSQVRQRIYNLCDGKHSVNQIADSMKRSIQQISNNIVVLQNAGLIKEVKQGKKKFYKKRG